MKERIGAFSDMTGLSPETIRYYEQLGLLNPHRQSDNRYRFYEDRDLFHLAQIKQFQGLGMTLADIAENVHQSDLSSATQMIKAQRAVCEQELEELEARLSRLKVLEQDYQRLSDGTGQAHMTRVRSMYRLMISDPGIMEHPHTRPMIRELVSLMPYAHTTMIVPQGALLDVGIDPIPTRYGIGILAHYANANGFTLREPVQHYPTTCDLVVPICVRDFRSVTRAEMAPLLDEFERRSLRVVSDAHALIRHAQNAVDGDRYYMSIHASYA